jgi:hypothetical protein
VGKNGGKIPGETSYMQGEIFKQRVLKSSSGQVFFGDSNGVCGVTMGLLCTEETRYIVTHAQQGQLKNSQVHGSFVRIGSLTSHAV